MYPHKTGGKHSRHYSNKKSTSVIAFQFLKGKQSTFFSRVNILVSEN